jgi:predicted GIY-YIG superfamily endonuclease
MEKRYVYELVNSFNKVEYVGETNNPQRRFKQHTKIKPNDLNSNGKFYNRTDISMRIVKEMYSRSESFMFQSKLQTKYGLESDRDKIKKSASICGKITGPILGKKAVESGLLDSIRKIAIEVNSIPLLCWDKNTGKFVGEYKSAAEAGRVFDIKNTNITKCLKGKGKSAKGLVFKYKL